MRREKNGASRTTCYTRVHRRAPDENIFRRCLVAVPCLVNRRGGGNPEVLWLRLRSEDQPLSVYRGASPKCRWRSLARRHDPLLRSRWHADRRQDAGFFGRPVPSGLSIDRTIVV